MYLPDTLYRFSIPAYADRMPTHRPTKTWLAIDFRSYRLCQRTGTQSSNRMCRLLTCRQTLWRCQIHWETVGSWLTCESSQMRSHFEVIFVLFRCRERKGLAWLEHLRHTLKYISNIFALFSRKDYLNCPAQYVVTKRAPGIARSSCQSQFRSVYDRPSRQ